jgi:hypothetical protein
MSPSGGASGAASTGIASTVIASSLPPSGVLADDTQRPSIEQVWFAAQSV